MRLAPVIAARAEMKQVAHVVVLNRMLDMRANHVQRVGERRFPRRSVFDQVELRAVGRPLRFVPQVQQRVEL